MVAAVGGERRAMKLNIVLFLLLCLSLPSFAQFKGSGNTFNYGQEMTITVPAGLTGAVDEDGALTVKDATGAFVVTFIRASNQAESGQVCAAMATQAKKVIPDLKVNEPKSAQMGGNTIDVQDGLGTIEKIPFDVTVGSVHNSTRYLCFFSLLSQADMARWDPLMKSLIESIKFN